MAGKATIARPVQSLVLFFTLAATPGFLAAQEDESPVDPALEQQSSSIDDSQESQELINTLDDQIGEDIARTRFVRQELNRLRIYNGNLEQLVADQEREKQIVERQISEFSGVERDVVPFMFEMIAALERFIRLDMPFLQKERADRVTRLKANMDRANLSVTEKYRQIMEAYQIEASYGRNIEAYIGTLEIDGAERRVSILRVGRVLLAYQTLDQSGVGFWDKQSGRWTMLDSSYRREIADGLRIARKQMAPRLLELPLPAAGAAE